MNDLKEMEINLMISVAFPFPRHPGKTYKSSIYVGKS